MIDRIKKFKYIIIGFVISFFGFMVSKIGNHDFANIIYYKLQHWEHHEIDELIIWISLFFLFIVINVFVLFEKRNQDEKQRVYQSMLVASNHILNTFLYQSQILKLEAEENIAFNKKTIDKFNQCANEAEALIKKLSEIEKVNEMNIHTSVMPNDIKIN